MNVLVPGGRHVECTLQDPGETDRAVAACPPHPQLGGNRSDRRLRAVADALETRGIACLRLDYGEWDEGRGERVDAENTVEWCRERYDRVGLFGYSFGGALALLAGASLDPPPVVSALAPATRVDGQDVVAALGDLERVQVVYGERDETADWEPIVDRARELEFEVRALSSDHHFVGQSETVGSSVAEFLDRSL